MFSHVIAPAVITSISTLIGVFLAQYFARKTNSDNHIFQLSKQEFYFEKEQREKKEQLVIQIHKSLSATARNFSQTSMHIDRCNEVITLEEYDQKYLSLCEDFDEVIAICALYFPMVLDDIYQISYNMNIYWGSLKEVVILTKEGKSFDTFDSYYGNALEASHKIASCCHKAKIKLEKDFIDNVV